MCVNFSKNWKRKKETEFMSVMLMRCFQKDEWKLKLGKKTSFVPIL